MLRDQNIALGAAGLGTAVGAPMAYEAAQTPEDTFANKLRGAVGMQQRTQGEAALDRFREMIGK